MDNPLFAISPLYLVVGFVILVMVLQEYLRLARPTLHRHAQRREHRHPHSPR
jgi:hypothetical protein